MSQRRGQQWGCGTWFVLLVLLGLSIEFWYVTVPVLAALIIGAVAVGSRRERRRPTRSRPSLSPSQEAERRVLLRRADVRAPDLRRRSEERRYRARCDWCGAPRWHGTHACRYCGRSLLLG